MSTSYSPCAACKCLRRKCTNECVFAPYFPPDNPQKFTNVHKVFGASNVAKLLNELNANQREDAVNSLAYEAEYRLKDPVYGCVGLVAILQQQLKKINQEIDLAKKELATYIGPAAMQPMSNLLQQMQQQQQQQQLQNMMPYHVQQQMMLQMGPPRSGGGALVIREPQQQQQRQQMLLQQQQQQQQMLEAQQLAAIASAREREMLQIRAYEQQQQQQLLLQQNELMRFHDGIVNLVDDGAGPSTATSFNQMMPPAEASSSGMLEPSLALGGGSYDVTNPHSHSQSHSQYSHPHELIQLQLQQQQEYLLQHQQQQLLATQQQLQMQQALQQLSQPQASNSQQQQQQQIQIDNSDDARSIDPS